MRRYAGDRRSLVRKTRAVLLKCRLWLAVCCAIGVTVSEQAACAAPRPTKTEAMWMAVPTTPGIAPPEASDTMFVATCEDGNNPALCTMFECPNGCGEPRVLTYYIKIDRVLGHKATLEEHGLLDIELQINNYGAGFSCYQASDGFPCAKNRITINGHDISDNGGILRGGDSEWMTDRFKIPAADVNFGDEGPLAARKGWKQTALERGWNEIKIYFDEDFYSSGRANGFIPNVRWLALRLRAPRPVLLVPGNGSFASNSFGQWKAEFENQGIDYDESLDLSAAELMSTNADEIKDAIAGMKDHYKVKKVNVVAYSKGGIDVREYMRRYPQNNDIAHVVTMATPHLGIPLINFYWGLPKTAQSYVRWLLNVALGGQVVKLGPGTLQLTEDGMQAYNQMWAPAWSAPFLTLGGVHDYVVLTGTIPIDMLAVLETRKKSIFGPQDNDGVVTVGSANAVPLMPHVSAGPFDSGWPTMDSFHPNIDDALGPVSIIGASRAAPNSKKPGRHIMDEPDPFQMVRAPAGVVPHGGQVDESFVLESGHPAVIECSAGKGLRVELIAPSGDSLCTLADSGGANGFQREERGLLGEPAAVFELGTPESGTWKLRMTDSLSVPDSGYVAYVGFVEQQSTSGVLTAGPRSRSYTVGSAIELFARDSSATPCAACTATASIVAPDSSVTEVALNDAGVDGDVTANDGEFAGTYSPPNVAGPYRIGVEFTERSDSVTVVRQRSVSDVAYAHGELAALGSVTGSDDVDVDADGLVDTLGVTVGVTGEATGRAWLRCTLTDESGDTLSSGMAVDVVPGSNSVRVPFSGTRLSATTGSHLAVSRCELWQLDGVVPFLEDSSTTAYTLPVRAPAAYEHEKVRLGSGHSSTWLDKNANGLRDSLAVRIVCLVDSTGTYEYDAWLSDSTGTAAGHRSGSATLSAGADTLHLTFDSSCLGRLAGTQSYTLKNLSLSRGSDVGNWDNVVTSPAIARDSLEQQSFSVTVVDTTVTGCPRGETGDGIVIRMAPPRPCATDPGGVLGRSVLIVGSATSPGIRIWYPDGMTDQGIYGSYGIGDTIRATTANLDSGTVVFRLPSLSGCGLVSLQPVVDGEALGSPLRVHVHSYDLNGLVVGAVDKFDQASVDSGTDCSDFDWSPGGSDATVFASHRSGKHAAWGSVFMPSADDTVAVGEVVPIRWTRLYGDSARVMVSAVKGGVTQVIQLDMPDTGYVTWTVPTGTATGSYEVRVARHAGLGQGSDGVIGTLFPDDNIYVRSDGQSDRIIGLRDTVLACPGGDADSVGFRFDLQNAYSVGSSTPAFVSVDSLDSGMRLWSASGRSIAVGDTVNELSRIHLANGHLAAYMAIAGGSGCGRVVMTAHSPTGMSIHGLRAYLRSVDEDARADGAVDRFDHSHWQSTATCDTCYACGDYDFDGKSQTGTDLARLDSHLGHHVARNLVWPTGVRTYALSDTIRITWAKALGDSARVTIRAIRGATSDTTLVVSDRPDSGSYVWTVPSTMRSAANYRIQVVHTAGVYAADYRNLGIAQGDTTIGIRPIPVADATTTRGKHSWTLTWTEPTQNGGAVADQYDVRYSGGPRITESNFSSMTVETPDALPGSGGTAHCVESDSLMLTPHKYYFAIKTRLGSVWSAVSSLDSASTGGGSAEVWCTGGDLMASGGGGEDMARSRPIAPERHLANVASVASATPAMEENSLLGWAGKEFSLDTYKLPGAGAATNDGYSVRLRQLGFRPAELDRVGLGFVDHASGLESYVAGSTVLLGHSTPAAAAWSDGMTVPGQFTFASADTPMVGVRGSALVVQMGGLGIGRAIIVSARGPAAQAVQDSSGILVEVPGPNSSWQAVELVHPRRQVDNFAISTRLGSQVRLVFFGRYEITGLRSLAVDREAAPTPLALSEAVHSRLGDVKAAESAEGGGSTILELGDTLSLAFAGAGGATGMTRDYFLTARGRYGVASSTDTSGTAGTEVTTTPSWAFSLGAARPNPSTTDFTIDYTLARVTPVTIRVYDVAGRLVRTLMNASLPAGPHSITWDGRNGDGRRVAASVYFYRMVAGGFSSEKKAVLLTH